MNEPLSKFKTTIKLALILLFVNLRVNGSGVVIPNLSQPQIDKTRLTRLPLHLVPSMERMQPPPPAPGDMRVYLHPSITAPEQQSPYIVPPSNPNQPAIQLAPPDITPPIQLSPPAIAPEQMHIQLEKPIIAPPKTPIELIPPTFETPAYPFPTITAP